MAQKQRLGLVLSGGGTRGLSHIGALKVLHNKGIRFDAIAGCSIGAIIGALYASGKTLDEIETFALRQKTQRVFSVRPSAVGLATLKNLEREMKTFIRARTFSHLNIPLYVNAANLTTHHEMVFSRGRLFPALRASSAVPGLMKPIIRDGDVLVDGGVLDVLPFSILPKTITHYIMINVSPREVVHASLPMHILHLMRASARATQMELVRLRLRDISPRRYAIISPKVMAYNVIEHEASFQKLIALGEAAARDALPDIRRKFRKLQNPAGRTDSHGTTKRAAV